MTSRAEVLRELQDICRTVADAVRRGSPLASDEGTHTFGRVVSLIARLKAEDRAEASASQLGVIVDASAEADRIIAAYQSDARASGIS